MKAVCVLILLATSACGQQQSAPAIHAESSGKCSPNILSNQGTVQLTCTAVMDKATADKMVGLLNQILQRQGSGGEADVNRKLDEILDFLRTAAQEQAPRQISSDHLEDVRQLLETHPAKVWIFYSGQDTEAYQLAKQVQDILVSSHWTLKEQVTAAMLMVGSGAAPLTGIEIRYRGERAPPGTRVSYNATTSWGVLCAVLAHYFPDQIALTPQPDFDADLIQLWVYPKPKPAHQ